MIQRILIADDDDDDKALFAVENHDGFITAESLPGKGATFNVLLPA